MTFVIWGVVLSLLAVGLLWVLWPTKTDFYLYFDDEAQAEAAIAYLKGKGFRVKSQLSGDKQQRLVLAYKSVGSLELLYWECVLTSFAASNDGEYDGYERNV